MLAEIILLISAVYSIFILNIAWRAMRAHETLAVEAKRHNDLQVNDGLKGRRDEFIEQKKQFQKFNRENPECDHMTPKERHQRFQTWLQEQS